MRADDTDLQADRIEQVLLTLFSIKMHGELGQPAGHDALKVVFAIELDRILAALKRIRVW